MRTVIVSVDGTTESRAAVQWCALNLTSRDHVIAVGAVGAGGEFILELPGFDDVSPSEVRDAFRRRWCAPLDAAGLDWEAVFLHSQQGVAIADIIDGEQPDLVVVGKPQHLAVDLLLHGQLQHVLQIGRAHV